MPVSVPVWLVPLEVDPVWPPWPLVPWAEVPWLVVLVSVPVVLFPIGGVVAAVWPDTLAPDWPDG